MDRAVRLSEPKSGRRSTEFMAFPNIECLDAEKPSEIRAQKTRIPKAAKMREGLSIHLYIPYENPAEARGDSRRRRS